jgi:hypothetical protein
MARIQGTFIDFSQLTNRYRVPLDVGADYWRQEMADIHGAGIEDVIIARTMVLGRTHYHSPLLEEWQEADSVGHVMDAAREQGLRVYLGLHLNLSFWNRQKDFQRMMRRDLALNTHLLHELMAIYRSHPMLAGVYVTNEPDRDNVVEPDRAEALREFMHSLYTTIHREYGLPVLTSPFFSKSVPPEELATWWDLFIDRRMFDVLAMQDGVGCLRKIVPDDIPAYYEPLSRVLKAHDVEFWNNVETFVMSNREDPLTPAPMKRIDRQHTLGAPFVSRSITWEYGHFLGRQIAGPERYEQFVHWNRQADGVVVGPSG